MSKAQTLHVKIEGDLVKALHKNATAQKLGVSEFVLRAIRFYLSRSGGKEMEIRRQYQQGYGKVDRTELSLEMKECEEEQVWPEP